MSMPLNETSSPRKSGFLGYAIALALLVAIVGGIAWLAQNLSSWRSTVPPAKIQRGAALKLVEFTSVIAQWSNQKKETEVLEKEGPDYKAFEPGKKGHYDFLFKNTAGQDIEVVFFTSSCSCTNVEAAAVDDPAWERLREQQTLHPAEPLSYAEEPAWKHLAMKPEWDKAPIEERGKREVLVKAGAGGVVRVHWNVNKSAGQPLNVQPAVAFRLAADHSQAGGQKLVVPVVVSPPVRFLPARIDVGTLRSGSTARERFYAFSSTREDLDLKLTPVPADGLFEVTAKPLHMGGIFSRSEVGELTATLKAESAKLKAPAPSVLAAYLVTVTVHESNAGKQLDLGTFFRRLEVTLDNIPRPEMPGPEIVGRVLGVVDIGGANDQRKVRFQSFRAGDDAEKSVELLTDAKVELKTFAHKPDWINVNLTRAAVQPDPKRTIWNLVVTVPPNTPGVRSFEEQDAVVLRVVGTPERFVRIPIEGTLSGGR
jgi:hypothetical protein